MSDVLTPQQRYRRILERHLPPDRVAELADGSRVAASAVGWVYDFLERHRVHFHITRERRSKLGDYRRPWPEPATPPALADAHPRHPFHEISVNGDLGPLMFLWVFIHEAAHLETHLRHRHVQPHGHEWQEQYRQLLVGCASLFPDELRPLLDRYTRRVPLNRAVGRQIEATLRRLDSGGDASGSPAVLDDLQPGAAFRLRSHPDRRFLALDRRRTRWLCRDLDDGRQFLVSGSAEIVAEH